MRRVFRTIVGGRTNDTAVRRAPVDCALPWLLLNDVIWPRAVVVKISLPSRKKSRFSGKNVSRAVRLITTSSDSTAPKSGLTAPVTWKAVDGRQKTSRPTLASWSLRTSSNVADAYGNSESSCLGATPGTFSFPKADRKRAAVNGRAGQLQRSSMWATCRSTQMPTSRSSVPDGMLSMDHGRNASALQPSSSGAVALSHGPSHSTVNSRSGSTLPSITVPPRLMVNQKPYSPSPDVSSAMPKLSRLMCSSRDERRARSVSGGCSIQAPTYRPRSV